MWLAACFLTKENSVTVDLSSSAYLKISGLSLEFHSLLSKLLTGDLPLLFSEFLHFLLCKGRNPGSKEVFAIHIGFVEDFLVLFYIYKRVGNNTNFANTNKNKGFKSHEKQSKALYSSLHGYLIFP